MRGLNFKSLLCNSFAPVSVVAIHYQQPGVLLEGFCFYVSATTLLRVYVRN